MQQPSTVEHSRSRGRSAFQCVVGAVGVGAVVASALVGAPSAFAAGGTEVGDFSQLSTAFGTSGVTEIDVTQPIQDDPQGVLTLAAGNTTILDLQGNEVDLQRIQLSSVVSNQLQGANLVVVDSDPERRGLLSVDNSAATGSALTRAAIEVDADAGSTLSIQGAKVTVRAATSASATAGGIGGGTWNGLSGASGSISVLDYNGHGSVLDSTGSRGGSAIGDGTGAGAAQISIVGHSIVTAAAPVNGLAAAIGGGDSPQGGRVAGPSVTIDDFSQVTATSSGAGAAIGGGRYGAGGTVNILGQSTVVASGDASGQAGIGDGAQSASSRSTQVSVLNAASLVATGGGNGGAGVGGGASSYGGDSLSIAAGASVKLAAAPGLTAFGAPTGAAFGTLTNSGRLELASGSSLVVPSGASISSDGTFVNNGSVTIDGGFTNSGSLANSGSITVRGGSLQNSQTIDNIGSIGGPGAVTNDGDVLQKGSFNPGSVSGNAFEVIYDGQGGTKSASTQRVYARSFSAAGLGLATASPASTGSFTGWNLAADGSGAFLGAGDNIANTTGMSASGSPAVVNIYAIFQIAPALPTGSLPQAVVGSNYSSTVAATAGTAPVTYAKVSGDLPAGLTLDPSSGVISGVPTTSGVFTMTIGAANAYTRLRGPVSRVYTIEVLATPLTLVVPRARLFAGSTLKVSIGGLQANESYTVTIAGRKVATGRAASNVAFSKSVVVPKTVTDGSQTVTVSGSGHAGVVAAKILTASVSKSLGLKLSAKKVKHGKKIVISISKLYAGESARVVIKGKHGKTAVGKATSKGAYVVTLKKGLAKGKYTVTVTGAGTGRKASAKLTVS